MTNIRTINTLRDLARVIIEEQREGRYPVSYRLPTVAFSDEGERANLSPNLQAIVEENMAILENEKRKVLTLTLKGLIEVADGSKTPEKGEDVKVRLDQFGEILLTKFNEEADVNSLSYHDLLKLRKILDSCCAPKNNQWKYIKYKTLARIKKLKGE